MQRASAALHEAFGVETYYGHRRQPKGRRAKSGQWWRRELPPMTFMELADYSFRQSEKKDARMRPPEPMPDWREPHPLAPSGRDTSRTDTTLMETIKKINDQFQEGWKP